MYHGLPDPDPAPDPPHFVNELQDSNKKKFLLIKNRKEVTKQ
jgi:hypothetical protein